ncbi:salicylate hydroxylase [Mesorhizobium albiziae]|uniref:Salicylate hydroxylase n=1 Tax=Neomesorhizobium albiziae TaxID=335020 RepID=A0A1I4DEU4_9HYPH|nr:FAD-dependent monooxygenase [Mesorhizobium albiziae]GLS32333.1 salicylate hydroxylase [Mesorhizobium albiziae]SFK90947.1 salicylate hydroxylase [Mesorhizobium albiziae]
MKQPKKIVIAGAGIAGLTAALAFASKGFDVRVFERAEKLEEVGAGLQLSPNATRLLDRLGVLDLLRPLAVQPEAIVLRKAATLKDLAHVPLGEAAERRWEAPYLVAHRADLQAALLQKVLQVQAIELVTGMTFESVSVVHSAISVRVNSGADAASVETGLLVGADGVWSAARGLVNPAAVSRFVGELAWRTTISSDSDGGRMLAGIDAGNVVTAFLHPGAHMIVYPVRGGRAFNLVAFTPGERVADGWSAKAETTNLLNALRGSAAELIQLVQSSGPWTQWPVHAVDASGPWTREGQIALIGDAAHAMTPFAAQGAAMAIEDAVTLADAVSDARDNPAEALRRWEADRHLRVQRVARRGALNRFAWHARGPVALARDLFLKARSPDALAADVDWLYGWRPGV